MSTTLTTTEILSRPGWTLYQVRKNLTPSCIEECSSGWGRSRRNYVRHHYALADVVAAEAARPVKEAKTLDLDGVFRVYRRDEIRKAAEAVRGKTRTKKERLGAYREALGVFRLRSPDALDAVAVTKAKEWDSARSAKMRLRAYWVSEATKRHHARQWEIDRVLTGEAMQHRALECMHAANRAAKHSVLDARKVYPIKDAFLDALVRTDRAKVGTFTIMQRGRSQFCHGCDRSWTGDNYCYVCEEDSDVESEMELRTWYLIDCGGKYRFHQPKVSPAVAAIATPIEAHDPTQPARAVPDVGLSLDHQLEVVRLATSVLLETLHGRKEVA